MVSFEDRLDEESKSVLEMIPESLLDLSDVSCCSGGGRGSDGRYVRCRSRRSRRGEQKTTGFGEQRGIPT